MNFRNCFCRDFNRPFAYTFFCLAIFTIIVSCNSDVPKSKIERGEITHNDTIANAISALPKLTLPFGYKDLIIFHFAKEWTVELEDDGFTHKKPVNLNQKILEKATRFYDSTFYNTKAINLQQFEKVTYLNIVSHDDSLFMKDLQRFKFTCDFKYRLPDFGIYQCYFQTLKIPQNYHDIFVQGGRYLDNYYLNYGNLVFYNPVSKQAFVLNVYYDSTAQERFGEDYKFFYIEANGVIKLFNAGEGEEDKYFHKSQEISVQHDGFLITKAQ